MSRVARSLASSLSGWRGTVLASSSSRCIRPPSLSVRSVVTAASIAPLFGKKQGKSVQGSAVDHLSESQRKLFELLMLEIQLQYTNPTGPRNIAELLLQGAVEEIRRREDNAGQLDPQLLEDITVELTRRIATKCCVLYAERFQEKEVPLSGTDFDRLRGFFVEANGAKTLKLLPQEADLYESYHRFKTGFVDQHKSAVTAGVLRQAATVLDDHILSRLTTADP